MHVKVINKSVQTLDVTPKPEILKLIGEYPLAPVHCFAELIDNSIDNFKKNKISGEIDIKIENNTLRVVDNGSGMTKKELEQAVKAASSDKSKSGDLGLFGIGFNIATSKLGNVTKVYSKKSGERLWNMTTLDIQALINAGNYTVNCDEVELKSISASSGTIIEIQLKPEKAAEINRPQFQTNLREQLGEIYTFMLRKAVPGLTGEATGNYLDIKILVSGKVVKPKLPCIWAETRNNSDGIPSLIKIDEHLPDLKLCQECGSWEKISETICSKCKSDQLSTETRRIWGWIGLQRFLDTNRYGISFFRNGRAIEISSKEVFKWRDPHSNYEDNEYPVEMPASKGRIVGEIHCSHCSVSPSKDKFNPDDLAFQSVISHIRGQAPLKPNTRKGSINTSVLNSLFKAYRRNDPGLKCLIPGDGKIANHNMASNWGERFAKGEALYQTDKEWYNAALTHDKIIKSKSTPGSTTTPVPIPGPKLPKPGPGARPITTSPPSLSTLQKTWESVGKQRLDISFTFARSGETWDIKCFETIAPLQDDKGTEHQVFANPGAGREIKIYVNTEEALVSKYGRDTTDLLLIEAAHYIGSLPSSKGTSITDIYLELLKNLPDQKMSQSVLIEKISDLHIEIRKKMLTIVSLDPHKYFNELSKPVVDEALREQISKSPRRSWVDMKNDGTFVEFICLKGIVELIEKFGEDFFDGNLFMAKWTPYKEAQERVKAPIINPLLELHKLREVKTWSSYERDFAKLIIRNIHESII